MSELREKLEEALKNKRDIWLTQSDGSNEHLTAPGNEVNIADGKECEWIEVKNKECGTKLYNLDFVVSIQIE